MPVGKKQQNLSITFLSGQKRHRVPTSGRFNSSFSKLALLPIS
jgi:hypothetical protein